MVHYDITDSAKPDSVMESTTDAVEWKLEVERVLPWLKFTSELITRYSLLLM